MWIRCNTDELWYHFGTACTDVLVTMANDLFVYPLRVVGESL